MVFVHVSPWWQGLRLVNFVCVFVMSVKLALAGRLWQTGVCVCSSCQLNWLWLVDFGRRVCVCVCHVS